MTIGVANVTLIEDVGSVYGETMSSGRNSS
jgi:hypothetical protein